MRAKFIMFSENTAHASCNCYTWEELLMCLETFEEHTKEARENFVFVMDGDVLNYRQMMAVCDALPSKHDLI